jgi:ATP-dependent DNA helicase RecQ
MTMEFNAADRPMTDGGFNVLVSETTTPHMNALKRLIDASSKIPGLTLVSPNNLEILESLGKGLDLIISGPERLASLTCAALPAMANCGLVLVVTHSLTSIRKLKNRFEDLHIRTQSFDLAPSKPEKRSIWEALDRDEIQILIVTPGRLASRRFRERLKRRETSLIIIDQAHLMSPWSHRFEPNYRFLGSYLTSFNNKQKKPTQKVALVWNTNARISHDLSKLLALRTPTLGRLTPCSQPTFAIESKIVSSDCERTDILTNELDSCEGQIVIYCNTIRQLFDSEKILIKKGYKFAVNRPGLDEFLKSNIRKRFESGEIQVLLTIGPFLSDLESTQGLDRIIFNGLPDSPESLAKEIFTIDDRNAVNVRILSSEKDYFHHRFLIDKNYPDTLVMRACVEGVRDVFGSKQAVTPEALVAHVKMATPYPGDDIEHCIQVLFREGVLEKLFDNDSQTMFVNFALSIEDEANFWHEYPLRKIDHVSRLDRMRELSNKNNDYARYLKSMIRV